ENLEAASPSSAHTYRLLVFKEHSRETRTQPSALRSASLHQQQRNEIMKNLFPFVNKFFAFASKLTDLGDRLFPSRPSS
ncbi:hypothetical protein, partial [Caballeronia humi]|uniref:hypothetical protein n=1 Tax=Caballeronia humi TaxID=326474 RepID=UPI001F48E6A4